MDHADVAFDTFLCGWADCSELVTPGHAVCAQHEIQDRLEEALRANAIQSYGISGLAEAIIAAMPELQRQAVAR